MKETNLQNVGKLVSGLDHFTVELCLIRHLKGIRKKWRFRRSDELCKQVKTLS